MKKNELINLLSSSTDKKYVIDALIKLLENNRNYKNNELLWNIAEINCRWTGKSTRYADDIIQEMFNNPNKWITIIDYNRDSSIGLAKKIKKRITNEHNVKNFEFSKTLNGFPIMRYKYNDSDIYNRKMRLIIEQINNIYTDNNEIVDIK